MKTRQEENIEMISKITEYTGVRSDTITNIVLIDISKSLAVIADALTEGNNKKFKENTNHISWSNLKNGTPIPPIEESRSDGSGIYRS